MSRYTEFPDEQDLQKKPSFFVRILFRHNGTLQGEVQWLDGEQTQNFRSAMELVALMDEAAAHSGIAEGEPRRRHWFDASGDRTSQVKPPMRRPS